MTDDEVVKWFQRQLQRRHVAEDRLLAIWHGLPGSTSARLTYKDFRIGLQRVEVLPEADIQYVHGRRDCPSHCDCPPRSVRSGDILTTWERPSV